MILQFLLLCTVGSSLCLIPTSSSSFSSSYFTSNTAHACMDHHKACPIWSKAGECKANPGYMLTHCKSSCGKCGAPCFDTMENCTRWAHEGKCKDSVIINAYCQKSCDSCGQDTLPSMLDDCVDQNDGCKGWAQSGECTANARWMLTSCANSCKSCIDPTTNNFN